MTSVPDDALTPLTHPERLELLRLARQTIDALLAAAASPSLRLATPALLAPGGAFVSLHHCGKLRGCVGSVVATNPLHLTVSSMARAAAVEDPRFEPLTSAEWPHIDIEISRLGPVRRAQPEEVVLGHHGVYISRSTSRGLLLPRVGTHPGWTAERLLRETCHKAGLHAEAWREVETETHVFVAEVFGENELTVDS